MMQHCLNAKLGNETTLSDIHEISPNGKILRDLVCKYNLSVINATDLCQGTSTRVNNKNTTERSVLDYVIVSEKLLPNVHSMHIDEDKLFTPWRTLKKGKKFSDHNAIILNLKITLQSSKASNSYHKDVWDFKNSSGWSKFHELTNNDEMLINIWKECETIEISYVKLTSLLGQCFKKKRISNRSKPFNSEIRALIKYWKDVKRTFFSTESKSSFLKLIHLDRKIDKKIARFNHELVCNALAESQTMNKSEFWKLKEQLLPNATDLPHAVLDSFAGNVITDLQNVCDEYCSEFKNRLRHRGAKDEYKEFIPLQNKLCEIRLKTCKNAVSDDFTSDDIKSVISEFKNGKSRDRNGFVDKRDLYQRR